MVPGRDGTGTPFSRTGASIKQSSLEVVGCCAASMSKPSERSCVGQASGARTTCGESPSFGAAGVVSCAGAAGGEGLSAGRGGGNGGVGWALLAPAAKTIKTITTSRDCTMDLA